jgi:beta-galactosidase
MSSVRIDERGVVIQDRRTTLLCSSLFYFRIPEGLWEDRLRKIHAAGYNCIDVYFPWNFHETAPGVWDFHSGMRDVSRFLALAAAEGLFVVARPGPYICSEWDGGSLPAWFSSRGIAIRQNDPAYLAQVREWYDRILPIIAPFQIDGSGTVILLQIENELDFFDCADPYGYLSALRDMAQSRGITVPMLACAGQGDFERSWAGTPGVVPSANLYLDHMQPDLESGVAAITDGLRHLGFPLLVMETGRDVLLLRRLLSCGAKLLGPYNQVGGYDFGFTTSVNNWGNPLAFQTSHYDFNSLVSSFGEVLETAWEDRALAGLLSSLGPVIAGALPCRDHGIRIESEGAPARTGPQVLRLYQQDLEGFAVAVHNTGDTPHGVKISDGAPGLPASMVVDPHSSAFAFIRLSLSPWNIPGAVLFSSAEPFMIRGGEQPLAVFQSARPAEIHIDLGGGVHVFRFDGSATARERIPIPGGGSLTLICASRRTVAEAWLSETDRGKKTRVRRPRSLKLDWKLASVKHDALFPPPAAVAGEKSLYMEDNGGYRGYALYGAELEGRHDGALGILFHDASDVLSLYAGDRYLGTRVPGGGFAWFPLPDPLPPGGSLRARAEIWGHSNFDDARLPAMRIGSRRGFSKATILKRKDPLFPWVLNSVRPARSGLPVLGQPGGGLTAVVPSRFSSSFAVMPEQSADRFFLWAEGPECASLVDVDGRSCGWIDRLHPILDLGGVLKPGQEARITLSPQKWYAPESPGRIFLAQGAALPRWTISRAEEPELLASAAAHDQRARAARLPLRIPPGGIAWLSASLAAAPVSHALQVGGTDVKASVFLNTTLVGRLFLPSPMRPKMAGGRDDCAYLPSCWLRKEGNTVRILLEAVGDDPARLDSISARAV